MGLDAREAGLLAGAIAGWSTIATALLLLVVAGIVLAANPRKPANAIFALFLALIAGNAIPDGLTKIVETEILTRGSLGFPIGIGGVLDRAGLAFLILDPSVLLYFAAIFPMHAKLAARKSFWAGMVALWIVFAAVLVVAPSEISVFPRSTIAARSLVAYMAACYVAAYLLFLRRLRAETSPLLREQEKLLVGAFGVALLFRLGSIPSETGIVFRLPPFAHESLILGIPWLAFGAFAAWSMRGVAPESREALLTSHRITLAGLGTLTVVRLLPFAAWAADPRGDLEANALYVFLRNLGTSALFFMRWTIFVAISGYAILKSQVFDLDHKVRRGAGVTLATGTAIALLAGAWGAGAAIEPLAERVGPVRLALVLGALVAVPFVARAVRRGVVTALPDPASRDEGVRRVEMYRAGLDSAMREGEIPPSADGELRRLRRALGISEEQHRVLLDLARLGQAGKGLSVGSARAGGRLAGRYELGAVIGEGSSGRCYLARDVLLGRMVVVKEAPSLGRGRGVLDEARAAGRLNHPNIVTVHDVVEAPGISYLVMEHAEGGSLRDALVRGPLPRDVALRILDDALAGLDAAHARGIVHGDIKPENVLLSKDGRAKLADFGSAHSSSSSATMASLPSRAGPGTLLYLAPEQVEGGLVSASSDLFAFAAIAHELFTGRHYLESRGKGDLELREAIARGGPRADSISIPDPLAAWLARGLEKDPSVRWSTAREMREALAAAGRE